MNKTEILLTIGEAVIPAVLNDSTPSKELIDMLPYTVKLQRYAHDYCGVMKALSYNQSELRNGWSNGDLAFAADGNYFAILYKDEEISQQYGNMVTLGKITVQPSIMDTLDEQISVTITLQ
ncbi:cyclophilin-like fold protein [Desulfogranum japonicum]|uniref:cyclophilin-like fold protein n=1 Tax=Desulfogranum japonicum TaxID=231447 RepID=UPI000420BD15|nr:cyclophilin-like fold protein [Desulfogranum japonicum]